MGANAPINIKDKLYKGNKMKTFKTILSFAMCFMFLTIFSNAQENKGPTESTDGTVKIRVIEPLRMTVIPEDPSPTNGNRPKLAPNSTKAGIPSNNNGYEYRFSIKGEQLAGIELTNNGDGNPLGKCTVTTSWFIDYDGRTDEGSRIAMPKSSTYTTTINQSTSTKNPNTGERVVLCYVNSITAAPDAQPGQHQVVFTLRANYVY